MVKRVKKQQAEESEPKSKLISKNDVNNMTVSEITLLIENQSQLVLADPQENIDHIIVLMGLLEKDDPLIIQLAMIALTEVFVDIAPLEKINEQQHQSTLEGRVNKEERKIIQFEIQMLSQYSKFIDSLRCFMEAQKRNEFTQKIAVTAITCLSKLLKQLYHFNKNKEVTTLVVQQIVNVNGELQEIVRETVNFILEQPQHSLLEIKFLILNAMSRIFCEKNQEDLPDWFVETINVTQIDTKYLPKELEKEEIQKRKDLKQKKRDFFAQQGKSMTKDKKNKKELKEKLEQSKKIFKEVQKAQQEAQPDYEKKYIVKQNGLILEKLFYIYFKIITSQRISRFYSQALDGTLQYIHLINVELIQNLIAKLIYSNKFLRQSQNKNNIQQLIGYRLKSIYTLYQIINGPGQVLDMDDKQTITSFYQILLDIIKKKVNFDSFERTFLEILEIAFLRKRQLSMEVVGSFIKELVDLIQITNSNFTYSILFLIKILFTKYSKTQKMVEEDNDGVGVNRFNSISDDPVSTNAINTSIYTQLLNLKTKYNKDQKFVSLIHRIQKQEALPQHLLSKKLMDIYDQ